MSDLNDKDKTPSSPQINSNKNQKDKILGKRDRNDEITDEREVQEAEKDVKDCYDSDFSQDEDN